MAASGFEVEKHRVEFERIIRRVMLEHTQRQGCRWKPNAVATVIEDIIVSLDSQEVCEDQKQTVEKKPFINKMVDRFERIITS